MGLEEGGVGVVGFGEIDGEADLREPVGGRLFAEGANVVEEGFGGAAAEVIDLAQADIDEISHGGGFDTGDAIEGRLDGLIIDLFLFSAGGLLEKIHDIRRKCSVWRRRQEGEGESGQRVCGGTAGETKRASGWRVCYGTAGLFIFVSLC